MAWLDDIGLGQLADAISSYFARKTEAGGSFSFANGVLSLISITGGTLDSENLDRHFANHDEAANHVGMVNGLLYAIDCDGNTNGNGVDIASAAGTSGLRYAVNLGYNDRNKTLWLVDQNGNQIGDVVTLS